MPDLELDFTAPAVEAAGEEFSITLTITNNEDVTIDGIRVESLFTLPNELLNFVSGPIDELGNDPRVNPISLLPGQSIVVTWTYLLQADFQ